jgi:mono/diheme cytochrome c family protein
MTELPDFEIRSLGGLIMKRRMGLFFATAFGAQALCSAGLAQDATFGAEIYSNHCVVCHGATGGGDGMVGELFAKRPANLRLLSRDNNGTFPTERVIEAIYGRGKTAGHGKTNMPVWGDYFITEALEGPAIDPADAAMITQGRVLSVVAFLEKLQVE